MKKCLNCQAADTAGPSDLCDKCTSRFDTGFESLLIEEARKLFQGNMLGITVNGIIFITDRSDFTAFIHLTDAEWKEFRDFLNVKFPGDAHG